MAEVFGFEGKLYYGTAGGTADTELDNCKDVSVNSEYNESDVSTRADNGDEAIALTSRKHSIEFTMLKDTTDANYIAISDAHFNRTTLAIKALDYAAGPGWQTDMVVSSFKDDQPLSEAQTVSVTMKRARGAAFTRITV